jgi:hypothetical protein
VSREERRRRRGRSYASALLPHSEPIHLIVDSPSFSLSHVYEVSASASVCVSYTLSSHPRLQGTSTA